MNILEYFRQLFRREKDEDTPPLDNDKLAGASVLWPVPGSASQPLQVATVYRCANLLADSVANLPLRYMRKKGDIFVEATESNLHYLLSVQPCPYMSIVDFWRQVVLDMLFEGNAYIVPIYDPVALASGRIEVGRLALVNPNSVGHDTINDRYTVNDVNAGVQGIFDEAEIIHIKNYTKDGKVGISTLTYARTVLNIATTGDRETLNRFANGGTVRGIVSNDTSVRGFGEYQDQQLDNMADDLNRRINVQGRNITAVHGQARFDQISMNSADMQFLESRKFTVRDICRFFGVHPSFVFDDTSNNYKSAEMANVAFLANTLNPLLRKIEMELHRKLVPASLCCKRRFEFDRRGLYACDLDSKVKYQTATIAAGIYSVNDWRLAENQPPVEGGDVVLVSANLKSIEEAGKPAPAPQPAAPEPGKEEDPETDTDNDYKDNEEK